MASGNCFYDLEARLANREGRAKRLARLKSQSFGEQESAPVSKPGSVAASGGDRPLEGKQAEPEKASESAPSADERPAATGKPADSGFDAARVERELDELRNLVEQTPALEFLRDRIASAKPEKTTASGIIGFYRVIASTLKNPQGAKEAQVRASEAKRLIDMELAVSQKEKEAFMFKESLAMANKKLAESEKRYDKIKGDFDNYKGRVQQDVKSKMLKVTEEIMKKILPVVDNFERARKAAVSGGSADSLSEGVNMILEQFSTVLKQMGIVKMEPLHKPFDPMFHEALMTEVDASYPEDTVIEVLSNGYMMNGKLLRAASVKVSKR